MGTLQDELLNRKREIENHLRRIRQQTQALEAGSTGEVTHLLQVQQSISRQLDAVNAEIEADRKRIARLRYWLTIETIGGFSTGTVVMVLFMSVRPNWVYALLAIAAVALVPLLVSTLIRGRRTGWLAAFAAVVVVPCILLVIPAEKEYVVMVLRLTPLFLFYVYCAVLRYTSDSWVEY